MDAKILVSTAAGVATYLSVQDWLCTRGGLKDRRLGQVEVANRDRKSSALPELNLVNGEIDKEAMDKKLEDPEVLVIGGAAAGVAASACLNYEGINNIVVNDRMRPGDMWRSRYDRLHLHDILEECHLPLLSMPDTYPVYPTREQFGSYLDSYCRLNKVNYSGGYRIENVSRKSNGEWTVTAKKSEHHTDPNAPETRTWHVKAIVISNGVYNDPNIPDFKGINDYQGKVIHSSVYTNGKEYKGKKVLIIGFGNSGAEISVDLWEHEADTSVLVRSASPIVPRKGMQLFQELLYRIPFLRIPVKNLLCTNSKLVKLLSILAFLPIAITADMCLMLYTYLRFGNLSKYGLKMSKLGPLMNFTVNLQAPVMDIGTIDLIRKGEIKVLAQGVRTFTKTGVVLEDGSSHDFDVVVMATGFKTIEGHKKFLSPEIMDELGGRSSTGPDAVIRQRIRPGHSTAVPRLFFLFGRLQMIRDAAPIMAENVAQALGRKSRFNADFWDYVYKSTFAAGLGFGLAYAINRAL
eukprot:Clim_evm8s33 gene=Clim_evmTU8s33